MKPFAAPVDDILFSFRSVARTERLPSHDGELTAEIVRHFAVFAEKRLAPLNAIGDRIGCRLDDGRVRMPDGFAGAYRDLAEQGWQGLALPAEYGGQEAGALAQAGVTEIFAGANHALQMVTGLVPGAARTLLAHGTAGQIARWLPRLASGEWLSTMALTEAGAGSDLSAIRTRARQTAGGNWRLDGEKIFISGGDHDLTGGILHLVLARTGSPGEGTRGLGLFLCPSMLPDGRRNAVSVTRIEEKMGLHASPTCQLAFDGAEAEIVGRPGGGLAAMFTMMDHARLDVALQGVAHAARAADIARAYATERIQGRVRDGRPAAILEHPDVAAMVDEADCLAVGGRAMVHDALVALAAGDASDLVSVLTPVAKWFCTNAGVRAADLAIQVLGGYGYLGEYGAEQTFRDARICSIYEGTNGIHAVTLATRLLKRDQGRALDRLADHVRTDAPAAVIAAWQDARSRMAAAANPETAATPFMALTAELVFQAAWGRIESAADAHPEPARIRRLAVHAADRMARLPWLAAAVDPR